MNIAECLEKGLLKQESPSVGKAKKSITIAQRKLESAKILVKLHILDMAEINIYAAMFHASRAILFKDGFKEKSHYAVYVYLSEKYHDKIPQKFLNELNVLRLDRHEIFYGLDEGPELSEPVMKKTMVLTHEYIVLIERLL